MDLRRANFSLFRDLLERIPWEHLCREEGSERVGWYSKITSSSLKNSAFLRTRNQAKGARDLHGQIKKSYHYSGVGRNYTEDGRRVRPLGLNIERL